MNTNEQKRLFAEYDLKVAELRYENHPCKKNLNRLERMKRRLAEAK